MSTETETPEVIDRICDKCSAPFTQPAYISIRLPHCPKCVAAWESEAKEKERQKARADHERRWEEICPPLYRTIDLEHKDLYPAFLAASEAWKPGPKGLGMMGESGRGKTRLLFHALRRAFDAGHSVFYIRHLPFNKLVTAAASGEGAEREQAEKTINRIRRIDVLLFDDLGKAPATDRCDAEIEDLIEVRGCHLLPTLWSANCQGGAWLEKRFGADRGPALLRRLAEFSTVVTDEPPKAES